MKELVKVLRETCLIMANTPAKLMLSMAPTVRVPLQALTLLLLRVQIIVSQAMLHTAYTAAGTSSPDVVNYPAFK